MVLGLLYSHIQVGFLNKSEPGSKWKWKCSNKLNIVQGFSVLPWRKGKKKGILPIRDPVPKKGSVFSVMGMSESPVALPPLLRVGTQGVWGGPRPLHCFKAPTLPVILMCRQLRGTTNCLDQHRSSKRMDWEVWLEGSFSQGRVVGVGWGCHIRAGVHS